MKAKISLVRALTCYLFQLFGKETVGKHENWRSTQQMFVQPSLAFQIYAMKVFCTSYPYRRLNLGNRMKSYVLGGVIKNFILLWYVVFMHLVATMLHTLPKTCLWWFQMHLVVWTWQSETGLVWSPVHPHYRALLRPRVLTLKAPQSLVWPPS